MKISGLLSDACEKFATVLATAMLVGVFCIVFGGVVLRFAGMNFSMSEELSRWGLVGICFVGASVALKQKQHVAVNMLVQMLPLAIGKLVVAVTYILVLILLVYFTHYSLKAALGAQIMRGDIIPISMMYVKLTLPLGMALMIVHLVDGFFKIPGASDINSTTIGS